jgi:hypothetical protein
MAALTAFAIVCVIWFGAMLVICLAACLSVLKTRFEIKKRVDPRRALADNTHCYGAQPRHPIAHRRIHRGHSSAGRAPALQAGGRRFDPVWLHQFS